ncbi:MAG TPA: hypothetical protein VFQ24_10215 [Terriglobia bacterium]|nr:hypothetical protein [Terriglobia bacterium]
MEQTSEGPGSIFGAASLTSNLDIGLRHILPVDPFLIAIAAALRSGPFTASRGNTFVQTIPPIRLLANRLIDSAPPRDRLVLAGNGATLV